MMFTPVWIISVSVLIVSFLGIIFSALLFSKPVDEYKFSFMRIFPFEVIRTAEKNAKYYTFSAYLFSGMCFSPLIIFVGKASSLSALNPLSVLITCLLGLAALCFVFLNVFDVTHVKPHLAIFTIFASLVILSGALIFVRGLAAYKTLLSHGSKEILILVTQILAAISVVYNLVIIVNPKLLTWAKLDAVDGTYKRPKRFVLAYCEWGLLLGLFINELIFFVQLLK